MIRRSGLGAGTIGAAALWVLWVLWGGGGFAALARAPRSPVAVGGRVSLSGAGGAAGAVVWLDAPGLHAAPLKGAVMDQQNKRFIPHILVVTPGTRISFPNNDTVFHNVFAFFEAKRFDLGMYPRGATRTQIFDKAGVVSVLCNVHSQMSAFIVIIDSPYRARADDKGNFSLPKVPPGTYTAHVWHESGEIGTAPCVVGDGPPRPLLLKTAR